MKRKLQSKGGESILELLCAILIVTLIFGSLCTATIVSNHINKQVIETNQSFNYDDAKKETDLSTSDSVAFDGTTAGNIDSEDVIRSDSNLKLNVWSTMNQKYYYFEKK